MQRPKARQVYVQKDRRDEAPPLPGLDQIVALRAVGQKHLILRAARKPHQEIDEDVGDDEDEGEGGGPRDDRAQEAQGLRVGAFAARALGGGRRDRAAAHHAARLARADERAAVAAHARSPPVGARLSRLTFGQDLTRFEDYRRKIFRWRDFITGHGALSCEPQPPEDVDRATARVV